MIIGIGTDIVEVERIKNSVEKFGEKFLNKIFTEVELQYSMKKKISSNILQGALLQRRQSLKHYHHVAKKGLTGKIWKYIMIPPVVLM